MSRQPSHVMAPLFNYFLIVFSYNLAEPLYRGLGLFKLFQAQTQLFTLLHVIRLTYGGMHRQLIDPVKAVNKSIYPFTKVLSFAFSAAVLHMMKKNAGRSPKPKK
jgi:hypothetical protein